LLKKNRLLGLVEVLVVLLLLLLLLLLVGLVVLVVVVHKKMRTPGNVCTSHCN
jgi:hypothetical protein